MKLPSWRRIFTTDYDKQYQKLIDTLAVSLNNAMDSIFGTLNNNVSLADNIFCDVKMVTVTVNSTGTPVQGLAFTLSNVTTPLTGVQVINALNNTKSTIYPTSQPFISYTQSGQTITINNITGLQANNNYTLTIVAYG